MDDTSWFQDLIRFALTATPSTKPSWVQHQGSVHNAAQGGELINPDDPGKDPRFRKVVEAVLYSRRLLKTYNLVLLAVLAVVTAWHWGAKTTFIRNRKRREKVERKDDEVRHVEEVEAWSSSSSTIEGNATPPREAMKRVDGVDESSPLLSTSRPTRKQLGVWKPYYMLNSLLHHQPPPLPFMNKTLPTNAVSLFILSWVLLILFYNFYYIPVSLAYLFVFADRCGIIFAANLPLLYFLAAKNQPLQLLTGYSYECLNIFHRRVGEMMCFQAFLHFLGMMAVWYGMLRPLGFLLVRFIFNRLVLLGIAALVVYEVIYFTSLGTFRQRCYEVFLATHIVLQVAGLVFLWFHYHTSRPYVGISLVIFLIDRVVYRTWIKSSTHSATLTVLEDKETLLLSANWDIDMKRHAWISGNMKYGWKPNEHVFISVPALSRKHAMQSHPFTIFSAAPSISQDTTSEHAWFSLLIRAQASHGFTHTLLQHAHQTSHIRIRLDGPYGSSHALDILSHSSQAILIAGGSGIAVTYPLLYTLLRPSSTDCESVRMRSNKKVKMLWITHALYHRLWLPEDKLQELIDWGLDVVIPPPTERAGRPDVKSILSAWVEDERRQSGVVVSGPEGLVRDVRNTCADLLWDGNRVVVQVEKFGW